jgi:AcrR family transcriptional regulator
MPRTKEVFQQIRDTSKQNILDKAAEVFVKNGLANTKVSDLVKAAGVSQGLLYWYFTDKDDVFIALLEQAVNGITNYVQDAVRYAGTPLEKLRRLTEQILQGMSENPVFFQLISQAMALSGRIQEVVTKLEAVGAILHEIISEGQTAGEIAKRDPDQLVFLYFSCLYGLAAGKSFNIRRLDKYFPPAEAVLQILKS